MNSSNTLSEFRGFFRKELANLYPESEIDVFFRWLVIDRAGLSPIHFNSILKNHPNEHLVNELLKDIKRLKQGEPIQYILGFAAFMHHNFIVRPGCLIPRPETEELVAMVLEKAKTIQQPLVIADVGTGSGCIGLTIAKALPHCTVLCIDNSAEALSIAKENAASLKVSNAKFFQIDFLSAQERQQLPNVDWVVSNPPYIPNFEKENMHVNVLEYEPKTALFVPDNDILVFYKSLVNFAKSHQANWLIAEIYENAAAHFSREIKNNFLLIKDMQKKNRFVEMSFNSNSWSTAK